MGKYIAERTVKLLIRAGKQVHGSKVAVLGLTFKENVPDLRNTKVVDAIQELEDYGVNVLVNDPLADPVEASQYYGIEMIALNRLPKVDAVIIAVKHNAYKALSLPKIVKLCRNPTPVVIDIKGAFKPAAAKKLNILYWRL